MPKIDAQLLDRLMSKLGVQDKAVYKRIKEIANRKRLPNNLAAIELASDLGISIQKYLRQLTPSENARISGPLPSAQAIVQNHEAVPLRSVPNTKTKTSAKKAKDNSVFVVHGRNVKLTRSIFDFLRALGLKPIEWNEALLLGKGANPQIEKIIDNAMEKVQAVVVLLSPDDEVRLKQEFCSKDERKTEGKIQGQARPNVLFEAGLALGRHPEKTLLIQVGKIKSFSDIGGKHIARLANEVPKRNDIANRLEKIGCRINRLGDHWMTVGNFDA